MSAGISTHNWALQTIGVLHRVVAVIPRGSVLDGFEAICERIPGRNGALSNAVDTVHIHRAILSNPMPMDTGTVLRHAVDDCDVESLRGTSARSKQSLANTYISPTCFEPGARVHAIKQLGVGEVLSVRIVAGTCNVQREVSSNTNGSKFLVVSMDIKLTTFLVADPAFSILRDGAGKPSFHCTIIAHELWIFCRWRPKHGATIWGTDQVIAIDVEIWYLDVAC